jgi:SNF2 family DNA or RNA helicase
METRRILFLYRANFICVAAPLRLFPETLQTITFLAWLKESRALPGPHLVIVPLNVLDTWCQEVHRWCPSFRVIRYHGSERERQRINDVYVAPREYDILVTTYETAVVASRYLTNQMFCYVSATFARAFIFGSTRFRMPWVSC